MSIPNIPDITGGRDCSLIHLLDENYSLKYSKDILNYNFNSLSAALVALDEYAASWNKLYTNFLVNKEVWLTAVSNIDRYSILWDQATSIVRSYSANWVKPISLIYPTIYLIDEWMGIKAFPTALSSTETSATFVNWLNKNFPPSTFAPSQSAVLQINLYQEQLFSFAYQDQYYELCIPEGGGALQCSKCKPPWKTCGRNEDKTQPGNAYTQCKEDLIDRSVRASCYGAGDGWLEVTYALDGTDTNLASVVTHFYEISGKSWRFIK